MSDRVGMPEAMLLEQFGQWLHRAFGGDVALGGPLLCGSAVTTRDWHDVDVRLVLTDEAFDRLFPDIARPHYRDVKWSLVCSALSALAKQQTGLPVDFQIQKESILRSDREAGRHDGPCRYLSFGSKRLAPTPSEEKP